MGLKNIQLDTHLIAASLRKVGGTTKTVLPGGAGTSENSATGPHKFEKLNLAHEVRCLPICHVHLNVSWKKVKYEQTRMFLFKEGLVYASEARQCTAVRSNVPGSLHFKYSKCHL